MAETLAAVHRRDGEVQLLLECRALGSAPARALLEELAAERAELVASIGAAVNTATGARLTVLATGGRPAPLRTAAPIGDAHLPAAFVLPAMLHRRWRKLVKETPADDLATVHRRAAELLVVLALAADGDVHVPALSAATGALLAAATATLRVESAAELRDRLPGCPTRTKLTRIAKSRAWTCGSAPRSSPTRPPPPPGHRPRPGLPTQALTRHSERRSRQSARTTGARFPACVARSIKSGGLLYWFVPPTPAAPPRGSGWARCRGGRGSWCDSPAAGRRAGRGRPRHPQRAADRGWTGTSARRWIRRPRSSSSRC